MESLLDDNEWIGEFFLPDQFETRFIGKVSFSPENGILLSYNIIGNSFPPNSELLYGVLTTGEKCTLVGSFSPATNSGFSVNNGLSTRNGKNSFLFFVRGEFVEKDEKFKEVKFSVTSMQEFFFPKGYKDLVKYSDKPLFQLKTNYGEVEIGNNASFSMLGKDITSQIYNNNEDALQELKKSFEEIDSRHEDSLFMLKKDIAYMITIRVESEAAIQDIYERIAEISNLFASLIYSPVYPESIKLMHIRDTDYPIISYVYPSLVLEARTIKLCKQERSHFHMPITASKIDLPAVVESWLTMSKRYSAIVSSLQHETGFRDEHSLHGELMLYVAQFESISLSDDIQNQKKYIYPVNKYGNDKIEKGLSGIFQAAGENDFGKGIGCLRNEIAHVGRPKRLLLKLSMRQLIVISQFLHVTIVGYLLHNLGIEKSVINKYQNQFTP